MESVKLMVVIFLVAFVLLYGVTQGEEEELFSRRRVDSGRLDSHIAEVEKQLNTEDFRITKKEPVRSPCGSASSRCSRRRRRRNKKKVFHSKVFVFVMSTSIL